MGHDTVVNEGFALILNQRGQVTGVNRHQPSWEDDKDGELTAIPTVERNLTQRSIGVRANIHLVGQTEFCPNGFSGGGG